MDADTGDWALVNGSTVDLCETIEDLTRQRVAITLRTFLGEWFANQNFGVPYFQSIYGKNTQEITDVSIKSLILGVDGIEQLLSYNSVLNRKTRTLTVEFKALTNSGQIIEEDITL